MPSCYQDSTTPDNWGHSTAMASDEIIWGIIDKQFCSYKLKAPSGQGFCHNEFNVTGICSRQSCPLANSRYATVRADPESGRIYLYMKTVERAHLPSKLWERIRLSQNYAEALSQIDTRLIYWPKFMTHKCKQRLTRLTQVAIRMRRIAKEEERLGERLVPKLAPKVRHREKARERKAEAAAQLEKTIERELLERLRSGTYGHQPLNVSETIWKKVLVAMEREGGAVRDKDMDKGNGDEDDLLGDVEYVSDVDESEDDLGDIEDWIGDGYGDDSGSDDEDEDDEDEDEDEDDSEDSATKKKSKTKAGDKRKRGRVVRQPLKVAKQPQKKMKQMVEYPSKTAALDF
ncbi:ribosomal large subunit biogenesis protein [Grosmannia clavigera kw1407]|uniref:Protein MAK16 n=1 Tax=Grosmannia clavigera (strain kw1407 / UAMH 11150) TaxID=655863 RepID=F0XNJ7_GROCL|nr:ribosomal large subunit biogenesis protein [Grosmannia clavigera kw1407]EFX00056.1 ribosomal large subunit biogenesis protein [Grosmannia clavigera kw1407]